jgi:ribose 5-phosphate isomerase B
MKIAIGSDMNTPVAQFVTEELKKRGHEVEVFGALLEEPAMWPKVALEVARKVADGSFDQAVLFCWTGTGISLAANKVKGIRAALCWDAETAPRRSPLERRQHPRHEPALYLRSRRWRNPRCLVCQ